MSPTSKASCDRLAAFYHVTRSEAGISAETSSLDVTARLPQFVGLAEPPAKALGSVVALVIGVGAVGRLIAFHLARLGLAKLYLVDPGRFDDVANLVTQDVARTDIDGHGKAGGAARLCKGISPGTQVAYYEGRFQELDAVALARDIDFVFLATDNLGAEVAVSQFCLHLAIPLIQASVHGETMVVQVRAVTNADASGPCLACCFGSSEWAHASRQTVFRCEGPAEELPGPPTVSTSFLCAQAASLGLTQFVRHRLGLGSPIGDTILQYCGFTHRSTQAELIRNPVCPCDHTAFLRVSVDGPLSRHSLWALIEASGLPQEPRDLSLALSGLVFVQSATCCGHSQTLERFVVSGGTVGACTTCGAALQPAPFFTWQQTPADIVMNHIDEPLERLGAVAIRWVVVRGAHQAVLLFSEADG